MQNHEDLNENKEQNEAEQGASDQQSRPLDGSGQPYGAEPPYAPQSPYPPPPYGFSPPYGAPPPYGPGHPYYGQMPPYGAQPYPPYQKPESPAKVTGLLSMIFGIAACVLIFNVFVLGLLLGVAGLVLAIVARSKDKSNGFAIAGLVLSILSLVMAAVLILFMFSLFGALENFFGGYYSGYTHF